METYLLDYPFPTINPWSYSAFDGLASSASVAFLGSIGAFSRQYQIFFVITYVTFKRPVYLRYCP